MYRIAFGCDTQVLAPSLVAGACESMSWVGQILSWTFIAWVDSGGGAARSVNASQVEAPGLNLNASDLFLMNLRAQ